MHQEARFSKLMVAVLMTTIMLVHSFAIRSHKLPDSPSPSPGHGVEMALRPIRRARRGSSPVRCNSKCNRCEPCKSVQVSIRTTDDLKENDYYPQVWKCMCDNNIFSP